MRARRAGLACLFLLLPLTVAAAATEAKVAVLDLEHDEALDPREATYLADGIRAVFVEALADDRFLVYTRENIFTLLPEGIRLSDCDWAECEVMIGRQLGADYVVTGQLLQFQGQWRVVLKLHETRSGVFLDARTIKAANLGEVEDLLAAPARDLAMSLRQHGGDAAAAAGAGTDGGAGVDWTWQPEDLTLLTLQSDPAGATVLVDGQLVCRSTPCTVEVPARTVRVTMHAEHHFPRERDVAVAAGGDVLRWSLEPSVGFVDVTAPDGAIVSVGGREMGYGSQRALPLKPGNHEISVVDPRYFPTSERLWVETGVSYQVTLRPEPREGGLVISATDASGTPVPARVYLDDIFVGSSPHAQRVIIGRHRVRLEGPDGLAHGQVQVREADVDTVRLELQPMAEVPLVHSPAAYLRTGRFKMGGGDEGYHRNAYPQHWVTLTRPYLLERHEVTVAEFEAFVRATGHITLAEAEGEAHVHGGIATEDSERTLGAWWGDPGRHQERDWPVTCVAFGDVLRYANWRSRTEGFTPVYRFSGGHVAWDREADGYRLPTEAEWEFAAICGGRCTVPSDDLADEVGAVGRNLPNELGIFGLLDGVDEWTWDGFEPYTAEPRTDPTGSDPDGRRVVRGRTAQRREWATEPFRSDRLGFRLARHAPALPDSATVVTLDPMRRAELLGLLAEQDAVAWEVRERHLEKALVDSLVQDRRASRMRTRQTGGVAVGLGGLAVLIGAGVAENGRVEAEDGTTQPELVDTGKTIAIVGLVVAAVGGIVLLAAGQDSDRDYDDALAEARKIMRHRSVNQEPALGVLLEF